MLRCMDFIGTVIVISLHLLMVSGMKKQDVQDKGVQASVKHETSTRDIAVQVSCSVYVDECLAITRAGTPRCPKCHATMVVREHSRVKTLFWACPQFPLCTGTRVIKGG